MLQQGYAALLIHFNWFKEVHLNCLPKGHTHEDIDQMFKPLQGRLGHEEFVGDIAELKFVTSKAYTHTDSRPESFQIDQVYDFKTLLDEVISLSARGQL